MKHEEKVIDSFLTILRSKMPEFHGVQITDYVAEGRQQFWHALAHCSIEFPQEVQAQHEVEWTLASKLVLLQSRFKALMEGTCEMLDANVVTEQRPTGDHRLAKLTLKLVVPQFPLVPEDILFRVNWAILQGLNVEQWKHAYAEAMKRFHVRPTARDAAVLLHLVNGGFNCCERQSEEPTKRKHCAYCEAACPVKDALPHLSRVVKDALSFYRVG